MKNILIKIYVKNVIKSQTINDISFKDFSILSNSNNNKINNLSNNLEIINNNFQKEDNKNIYNKEEIKNEDLENEKLINIILSEQYIEEMLLNENYIYENMNKNRLCVKCKQYYSEKKFDLCYKCLNDILDNECLVRYLLSIEENKEFTIEKIKIENNEYSFDELLRLSKYYMDKGKYIDYIKSKICVKCQKTIEKGKKLRCGCYMCEECYKPFTIINYIPIPSFMTKCSRCGN